MNDHAQVIVDNAEQQSGDEGVIVGEPTVITDMSVRTKQGAKRVARRILQANAAAKGSITSTGHMRNTDLRPGDTVVFNGVQTAVVESRHKLPEGISDLVLMNVDTGLEGVLTGIREGSVIEKQGSNPDTTQQKQSINLGFFGNIKINVALNIKERGVGTTKILLGGTKGTKTRGKIGKNGLQMGAAKRGVNNIRK